MGTLEDWRMFTWEIGSIYLDRRGNRLVCLEIDRNRERVRLGIITKNNETVGYGTWHQWDGTFSADFDYDIIVELTGAIKMDSDRITNKIDSMDALCSKGKQQVKELIAELFPEYKLAPKAKPGQVYRRRYSSTLTKHYLVVSTGHDLYSLVDITNCGSYTHRSALSKSLDELTNYISNDRRLQLVFETLDDYIKWYVNK